MPSYGVKEAWLRDGSKTSLVGNGHILLALTLSITVAPIYLRRCKQLVDAGVQIHLTRLGVATSPTCTNYATQLFCVEIHNVNT
jgi:hypothetical protein